MADSSLRRFQNKTSTTPYRDASSVGARYYSNPNKTINTSFGIPGMTTPGKDYRKKKPKPGRISNGIGVGY